MKLIFMVVVFSLTNNGTFGLNLLDGLKTGVIYQFELTSRIHLTNREETKTVDEQESSAAIFAQLLHQDSEKRVLVIWVNHFRQIKNSFETNKKCFQADSCVNSACPSGKQGPSKLFSVWSGSKIAEILTPTDSESKKWNVLRSFLFNLQYELETARVCRQKLF